MQSTMKAVLASKRRRSTQDVNDAALEENRQTHQTSTSSSFHICQESSTCSYNNCERKKSGSSLVSSQAVQTTVINSFIGRGVVLQKNIDNAGEVIYRDAEPIVALQHIFSQRCGLACATCFAFVGNLRQHIEVILKNERPSPSGLLSVYDNAAKALQQQQKYQPLHESLETLLNDAFLQEQNLTLAAPLRCDGACGAFYCNLACKEAAAHGSHRIFCTEASPTRRRKWKLLVRHALQYHENFILAALAFAQIICKVKYEGESVSSAIKPFLEFYSAKWESLAMEGDFQDQDSSASILSTSTGRTLIMKEAFQLLLDCLISEDMLANAPQCRISEKQPELKQSQPEVQQEKKEFVQTLLLPLWQDLFSFSFYSQLLGTFDLVNVNIEFDNPLNEALRNALQSKNTSTVATLRACKSIFARVKRVVGQSTTGMTCREEISEEKAAVATEESQGMCRQEENCVECVEDDSATVSLLPPFMGVGLFRIISFTNHSCWPNAEVDYPSGNKVAHVISLRPIAAGEEICQSYIDELLPLHARQKLLKQRYGFVCSCPRCRLEAAEALMRRRGVLSSSDDEQSVVMALASVTRLEPQVVRKVRLFLAHLPSKKS